jgi:hypothetical protein
MPEQDTAQLWKSFSPERRSGLLARMTADQKRNLRRAIEGAAPPQASPDKPGLWQRFESGVEKATEPTNVFPGMPTSLSDPAMGEMGLNTIKRVGRVLFGVVDFAPQAYGALKDALSTDPEKAADGETRLLEMHPGAQIYNRLKEVRDDYRADPKLAVANLTGDVAGIWLAGKVMEAPGRVVESLPKLKAEVARRYGPRTVTLAGEDIPVSVGEAAPESTAGRTQANLKRSGVGASKFERLENAQQAGVKAVIRKTAQQTSGLVGPMRAEPGAAMEDASSATFATARPMYAALDQSLVQVPTTLQGVSRLVQDAMVRARKLGAVIGDDNLDISKITPDRDGSIQWGGTRISKATHPERWAKLVDDGIIDDAGRGTPLSAYMKVRSQLLKMQRSAADPTMRYAIGSQVRIMNDAMDKALKGTPLFENWTEAGRLWSKAYALREVADAIAKATKGTPAAEQAPGLGAVPTKLQGAGLVNRLNTLEADGILKRAFTPEETRNLRQAADILDRIQRTRVGKGPGESMSVSRGLGHAVRGAVGPMIGAGAGLVVGGLRGAEVGAGIGFLVQSIGERALVSVMTRVDGVQALKAIEAAKSPSEMQTAIKALAMAAAASKQQVKTLEQLRQEAEQRRPVSAAAAAR